MKELICIKDILDTIYLDEQYQRLTVDKFPWYLNPSSVPHCDIKEETKSNYKDGPVFRHSIFWDSKLNSKEALNRAQPILKEIENVFPGEEVEFTYVSFNLLVPNPFEEGALNFPHIDTEYTEEELKEFDAYTGIFYFNDSDGDTVFVDNENLNKVIHRITPQKNTLFIWDHRQYHAAPVAPTTGFRVVLNINFNVKK